MHTRSLLRAVLGGVGLVAVAAGCGGSDGGGPTFASAHPRIYLGTNAARLKAALAAQTPAAMKFASTVDRELGGDDIYGFPAWNSALMGQLTGDPKYCAFAIAQVDKQVNDAKATISNGSVPDVAGDDYLYIGDDIGDLALTYDWCSDKLTADQQKDWLAYGQQAVFNIWNPTKAQWGGQDHPWDGWAIDDPSDNYYYSFLRATMLFGLAAHDDLPDANQWLTQFHDTKLKNELIPTFNTDLVGGGSREGTGYGVAMRNLFELYDFWKGSTGEDLATLTPHTRASMLDFMHSVLPTLDHVATTGDQARESTGAFFDYHRQYLLELIAEFPDDAQAPRAKALLAASSLPSMSEQFEYGYDFLYDDADTEMGDLTAVNTAYFGPGTGQLYARSAWNDPHATWMNFIGGPYTESHAHQDQTALIIYKDGWLAYDAVVESHSGLSQDTTAHNVVRLVDGDGKDIPQKNANVTMMQALHTGAGYVYAATDASPVYDSGTTVQREVVYLNPDCIVVYDRVTSSGSTVWQMAMPGKPTISGSGGAIATSSSSGHQLSIQRLLPASASASVHDFTADGDFEGGFRLDEAAGGTTSFLHVIWIDGAVGTVSPTSDGGRDGASISFADGGSATVSFGKDAIGANLSITPAGGGSPTTATLGTGVDTLPE